VEEMRLSIENLKFGFPGFSMEIPQLDLPSGKHFIMGPNGSGKTTLLKLIAGVYNPYSGRIKLDEKDVTGVPVWKRHVAYIPQNLLLFPHLNVRKNLLFSVNHGGGKPSIFGEIVEDLELVRLLDRKPNEISGGQAQRVAVARSIISSPDLMLMDEPLSMQDPRARFYLLSRLDDLMEKYSFSVIYVTHDQSDLDFGFDSLSFMSDGCILENVLAFGDVKNVASMMMLSNGNVIQIGDEFYSVNESTVFFSEKPGYSYRVWKGVTYNTYVLNIDGKDYFLKLHRIPEGKYMNFDLDAAVKLAR